jgi:hypothetical protein
MRYSRLVAAAISLLFLLPCTAQANVNVIATSVVPGCSGNVAILTITLDSRTYSSYGISNSLYYHFDPPSAGTQPVSNTNPLDLTIPTTTPFTAGSTHIVWISNSPAFTGGISSANYPFLVPLCHNGLTWQLVSTNSPTGTIRVGCGIGCDALHGDTPCTTALPLLCIKKTGAGFPLPRPASVNDTSLYNKWSGGVVGTTNPTVPPKTLAAANALCVLEFVGADWRVAEFHDGWGWYFQAYGGVGDPTKRFWIHINDQPGATCWQ